MIDEGARIRTIAKKMIQTPFREPWQWRLEIDDYRKRYGNDFDLFVREITYGPIEIETEQEKAGMQTITWPSGTAPVTLAMTVRDHEDRRVSRWFAERVAKIYNADGTINLPKDYLLTVRRFSLLHDNTEKQTDVWKMLPTQMGDITEDKGGEGVLEFPLTLIQFRS